MKIRVFIKPNSKQAPKIIKQDDFWFVFVKSPPIDGKANQEAQTVIAQYFQVPKSQVKLTKGHKSRHKTFEF